MTGLAYGSRSGETVAWMLRLARGRAAPGLETLSPSNWNHVLHLALRERCAASAWVLSGPAIRRHAPEDVVARWRGHYGESTQRCNRQLRAISDPTRELGLKGVFPIVLKGIPLSVRIYGDPGARSPADVDWFVRYEDRSITRAALLTAGWNPFGEETEAEASFRRLVEGKHVHLEVHSTLFHPRFTYLRLPNPEGIDRHVDVVTLRAHDGPGLLPYLAVHLATHHVAPLAWFVDFSLLWANLHDRSQARDAAAEAGVERFLTWAAERAYAIEDICNGDTRAFGTLGVRGSDRFDAHPMWRHVALVPTVSGRARAAVAWIVPPWTKDGRRPIVSSVARRIARYWRAALSRQPEAARRHAKPTRARLRRVPPTPALYRRSVSLNAEQVLATSREIVRQGGELWIKVLGQSMQPTLAPGDEVLLAPARPSARRGDIVLVSANGRPLLHRVAVLEGNRVRTRGDASGHIDRWPAEEVIARAIAVSRGTGLAALVPTSRFGVRALARYARSRARLAWVRWSRARRLS
jgi:hypothetical protein